MIHFHNIYKQAVLKETPLITIDNKRSLYYIKRINYFCVTPFQSSVRKGEAGRPAPLYKLQTGLSDHP